MIQAILLARTLNLSRIAATSLTGSTHEASYKRFIRCVSELSIDFKLFIQLLFAISPNGKGKMTLIIDRTSWSRGAVEYNILFVAVLFKDRCLPVIFMPLEKGAGGSSTLERIKLFETLMQSIPVHRMQVIMGDKEFGNLAFIKYLNEKQIPYCIRLKDGHYFRIQTSEETPISITRYADDLKPNQTMRLKHIWLGIEEKISICITIKRLESGQLLTLVHSPELKVPKKIYKKRWSIERLFLGFKSQGFNLECLNVRSIEKIINVLILMSLAYALVIYHTFGKNQARIVIKKHGYKAQSYHKIGLNRSIQEVLNAIKSLQSAPNLC